MVNKRNFSVVVEKGNKINTFTPNTLSPKHSEVPSLGSEVINLEPVRNKVVISPDIVLQNEKLKMPKSKFMMKTKESMQVHTQTEIIEKILKEKIESNDLGVQVEIIEK